MLRTLRARFLLASVGIAAIPVLVLGVAAGLRSSAELREQSLTLQAEIAGRVERDVAAFVSTRLSELRLLERTSQLVGAGATVKRATLARLLAHDQMYQSVAILGPDGTSRVAVSRTGSTAASLDRWAAAPFSAPGYWSENTVYVGPIEYSAEVREPLVDIAIPIIERRTGNLSAIIAVRVRFKPIWDLLADLSLPEETEAFVVGNGGRVLAHRSPAVVLSQTVFSTPTEAGMHPILDGRSGLVVWQPLSLVGGDARVVVTRPIDSALASANEIFATTIIAATVLLVLAALISLQLAGSILRPVYALAGAARRIYDGDLNAKIEPSGPDEIAMLGNVLSAMTERLRQTIGELERSEHAERQRALVTLESIGDAVITTDLQGRVLYSNPVAERLTGWPRHEAEGQPLSNVFEIIDGTTREPSPNPVDRCLAKNDVIELANNTILIGRHGRELMISDSAAPIRELDGTVRGVVLVFRDVTERKTLQKAVRRSQRMDAIGQLTGGIAHDFNNLLQVIQGNAELIREISETDPEPADAILRASHRGSELTNRLLAFGRRQTLVPTSIDTGALIADVVTMLSRTIGEAYMIDTRLQPGLWPAHADPGQLEAAVVNLVLNARDAMPGGGHIRIAARNAPGGRLSPGLETEKASTDLVAIDVMDVGVGMTPEIQEKATEPFFTTKKVGEGSGLGLSMVYGFVMQSRGALDIDSTYGEGTTITMFLPRASGSNDDVAKPVSHPVSTGNGETILVVEDNESVREQARKSLESLGYAVVVAEHVAVGRAMLRKHPEIALVLSDVVLPGGESGLDLKADLARTRPDLPVCLMSGYPHPDDFADDAEGIGAPILNKPFSRRDLGKQVAELLGTRAS